MKIANLKLTFAVHVKSWSSGFSLRRLRSTVPDAHLRRLKPELQHDRPLHPLAADPYNMDAD